MKGAAVRPYARSVWQFVRLGRPLFLGGGFLLHGLGVSVALYSGWVFDWRAWAWGQAAITCVQLMTHYSNDYFDQAADRANRTPTRWSGGSRVLVEGGLPAAAALGAAVALTGLALVAIGVLATAVRPGWGTAGLLLAALGLALAYSAPPFRLHSRGLGEVTVAALVTGLTPLTGFYLQSGRLTWLPALAVLPLACLQLAMLLAIEFPDEEGDRLAGKRTLVVRRGAAWAARLYLVALAGAYGLLPLLVAAGLPGRVAAAAGLTLPLALWQGWRMGRGEWAEPAQWGSLALGTIGLLMAMAAAEMTAFLL